MSDRHILKTIGDLTILMAGQDAETRERLWIDLKSAADAVAKIPAPLRWMFRIGNLSWKDDNIGGGKFNVRLTEEGPTLASWDIEK